MTSNSLYPLISKPTRITNSSATLIDNIFTNNLEYNMVSGIFYADLSDHLPVFQITKLKLATSSPPPLKWNKHTLSTVQPLILSDLN